MCSSTPTSPRRRRHTNHQTLEITHFPSKRWRLPPFQSRYLELRPVITSRQRLRVPMGPKTKGPTHLLPTPEGPWPSVRDPKLRVVQLWGYASLQSGIHLKPSVDRTWDLAGLQVDMRTHFSVACYLLQAPLVNRHCIRAGRKVDFSRLLELLLGWKVEQYLAYYYSVRASHGAKQIHAFERGLA
jgi:hypothetical protein